MRALLDEKEAKHAHENEGCTWHPEFGGWMIESTPSRPYSKYANDLLRVERNMILRRRRLLTVLKENEIAPTVSTFPLSKLNNCVTFLDLFFSLCFILIKLFFSTVGYVLSPAGRWRIHRESRAILCPSLFVQLPPRLRHQPTP